MLNLFNNKIKIKFISKKTIIYTVIIILLVLFLVLCIYLNNKKKNIKSNFDSLSDIIQQNELPPPTTTQFDVVGETNKSIYGEGNSAPTMSKSKGCSTTSDVVEFCIDYDNCCKTETDFNKCFCNIPVVKTCKANYDLCMQDPLLADKCKTDNIKCCREYNNIQINSDAFNEPIKNIQKDNLLCNVSAIKNVKQKCLELCQTTPECKAYSTTNLNCNLYSDISTINKKYDPETGKEIINPSVDFFIKK